MTRKMLTGFVLVAVLGLGLWTLGLPAQQPQNKENKAPAFTGKVIFVQAKDSVATVIEQPEVRTIGGRSFIVGKTFKNALTRELSPGGKAWIPVEGVQQIWEYEDLEKFNQRFGEK